MGVHNGLNQLLFVHKVYVLRTVDLVLRIPMINFIVDCFAQIWLNHAFLSLCIGSLEPVFLLVRNVNFLLDWLHEGTTLSVALLGEGGIGVALSSHFQTALQDLFIFIDLSSSRFSFFRQISSFFSL